MSPQSAADLLALLEQSGLLTPAHLDELRRGETAPLPDARSLARRLIDRGWLTAYQANLACQGRTHELVLGRYALLDRVGRGGMGQVYKARHLLMNRVVALKVVRPDRADVQDIFRRFRREIEAAARLSHPNIVTAHDAEELGGTLLFAMEYLEGQDFSRLLRERGPLPVADAVEYAYQAALGLRHAWEHGVVHRDIKPSNLMLIQAPGLQPGGLGTLKILDMGLARLKAGADDGLTADGAMMGTPDYIAPEQAADANKADTRADLYSLGCTLYHFLAGRPPFPGGSLMEKLRKHESAAQEPIEKLRTEVDSALAALLNRLMAKRPDDRYPTPAALLEALDDYRRAGGREVAPRPAAAAVPSTVWEARPGAEPVIPTVPVTPAPRRRSRRALVLAGAGLAVLLTAGALVALLSGRGTPPGPRDEGETLVNSIGMKLVRVPAGKAAVGLSDEAAAALPALGRLDRPNEVPRHEVVVTAPFYLGAFEVTQAEYKRVMGNNPSYFSSEGAGRDAVTGQDTQSLPVESVSWPQAMEFCRKLSERPEEKAKGRVYRLPTEAEWEYACRLGQADEGTAWLGGNSGGRPNPVGTRAADRLGAHDLLGNVHEWCLDWYSRQGYTPGSHTDPTGPFRGDDARVVRGGSWASPPVQARPTTRLASVQWEGSPLIGFRVVLDGGRIPPPDADTPLPAVPADNAVAWEPAARDTINRLMHDGLRGQPGRLLYSRIATSLARAEDNEWAVGPGLTQSQKAEAIRLSRGQLSPPRTLDAAEIARRELSPTGVASRRDEEPIFIHPRQLVTLRKPHLWPQELHGRRFLAGHVYCDAPDVQALRDVTLVARRDFSAPGVVETVRTYQWLDMAAVPSGWLAVLIELPVREGPNTKGSPPADGPVTLHLRGFAYAPAPGVYQISNDIKLTVGETTVKVSGDTDEEGWDRRVREQVEEVVRGGLNNAPGRRMYGEILAALESGGQLDALLGSGLTKAQDGRGRRVEVKKGEITVTTLTEEAARDVPAMSLHTASRGIAPPRAQPAVRLVKADLHVEGGFLTGEIRCAPGPKVEVKDLLLVLDFRGRADRDEDGTKGPPLNFPLYHVKSVGGETIAIGQIALKEPLPKGEGRLSLRAFMTWPRPELYAVSNELPFGK